MTDHLRVEAHVPLLHLEQRQLRQLALNQIDLRRDALRLRVLLQLQRLERLFLQLLLQQPIRIQGLAANQNAGI